MEQRVAVVTGGLRGLGRAMALGSARQGHAVVAVGISPGWRPNCNRATGCRRSKNLQ
jgi:NAD(P)-dependent dehydrogenase (short-subunit alcohol dehydrogenase family)